MTLLLSVELNNEISQLINLVHTSLTGSDHKTMVADINLIIDRMREIIRANIEKNLDLENKNNETQIGLTTSSVLLVGEVLKILAGMTTDSKVREELLSGARSFQTLAGAARKQAANSYFADAFNLKLENSNIEASRYRNVAENLRSSRIIDVSPKEEAQALIERVLNTSGEGPSVGSIPGEVQNHPPSSSSAEPVFTADSPRGMFSKRSSKYVTPNDVRIKNGASPKTGRKGWFDWWIYLDAEEEILNRIKSVTYNLHPTFYNPQITIHNRDDGFRFQTSGWGEFEVKVDIVTHDGKVLTKYHWLDLDVKSGSWQGGR